MVDTHFTSLNALPKDNLTGYNGADNLINRVKTYHKKRCAGKIHAIKLLYSGPDGIRPVML